MEKPRPEMYHWAMGKDKAPMTPAVRALREAGVPFTKHPYAYFEHGGTAAFAAQTGVDEHAVVKTLVMEDVLN